MRFLDIFKELNRRRIKYLVAGGMAVNLHGYIRATADLDIMLLLEDLNISRFIKMVKGLGYQPRVPVALMDFAKQEKREEWKNAKEMKVFSVFNPQNIMEGIDVMLEDVISFKAAYKRHEIVRIGRVKVPVASILDLIKLKEHAGRERDKIDIAALKKIKGLKND
jgi:hypothetical protein